MVRRRFLFTRVAPDPARDEIIGMIEFEDGVVIRDDANLAEVFQTGRWNTLEDAMNHYAHWDNGYLRSQEVRS